jgi:hypothetical protein
MTSAIYTNDANPASDAPPAFESISEAKVSEFLTEHGEIEVILPVVLGLIITSRFQLRGAQALLANLLVGSLVRQILLKLKNPEPDPQASPAVSTPQATQATTSTQNWGDYEIIHSIPGRVRMKIPQLAADAGFAKRLVKILNDDDYVINARVNIAAISLVINYDAKELADWELGLRLMNLIKAAETEAPVRSESAT